MNAPVMGISKSDFFRRMKENDNRIETHETKEQSNLWTEIKGS